MLRRGSKRWEGLHCARVKSAFCFALLCFAPKPEKWEMKIHGQSEKGEGDMARKMEYLLLT